MVSDDDISGTLTFIRALEDSGLYGETPAEFVGDTWLNYLIPQQTVLWWGGMGVSTEHTAYLRLKQGLPGVRRRLSRDPEPRAHGPGLGQCAGRLPRSTDDHQCRGLGYRLQRRKRGFVDAVTLAGAPHVALPGALLPCDGQNVPGWIQHADRICVPAPEHALAPGAHVTFTKNEGRGILITGNTDWANYSFSAQQSIHVADQAGLLIRHQGLERYLAVVKTREALQLVLRYYGDTVLDETACRWEVDAPHGLRVEANGERVTAWCDGKRVLQGTDCSLGNGGAGLVLDTGTIRFSDIRVSPLAGRRWEANPSRRLRATRVSPPPAAAAVASRPGCTGVARTCRGLIARATAT